MEGTKDRLADSENILHVDGWLKLNKRKGGAPVTTTLTVRGQTVIPAPIRRAHRLKSSTKLEWIDDGKCIRVVPLGPDTIGEARGVFGKTRLRQALLQSRAEDKSRG